MHESNYYHRLKSEWTPDEISLVWLFESPPVSGKYFYDVSGRVTETLFSNLMKLYGWEPKTKTEGLSLFRNAGLVLWDGTYTQVNHATRKDRVKIIAADYPELKASIPRKPIVIGAVTVLDAIGGKLVADGFDVLNNGVRLPFPGFGQQGKFHRLAPKILNLRSQ
jgi:hypothetical protein